MISYLVDTDWIIDYLKGKKEAVDKLSSLRQDLNISIISLAELYEGVFYTSNSSKHLDSLNNFIHGVNVIEINNDIAQIFGKQRAKLRKAGKLLDNFDLLIASTCLCNNLTLITNNTKHFERIDKLKIYLIK